MAFYANDADNGSKIRECGLVCFDSEDHFLQFLRWNRGTSHYLSFFLFRFLRCYFLFMIEKRVT